MILSEKQIMKQNGKKNILNLQKYIWCRGNRNKIVNESCLDDKTKALATKEEIKSLTTKAELNVE